MCEEAEGIVLQEAGEKVIVTSVESIVEKGCCFQVREEGKSLFLSRGSLSN